MKIILFLFIASFIIELLNDLKLKKLCTHFKTKTLSISESNFYIIQQSNIFLNFNLNIFRYKY